MQEPADLFIKEKPSKALVTIRRNQTGEIYGSMVSTKIDTTYAHTVKILAQLEDHGLIRTEKKGRKKLLELTEKGDEYAEKLQPFIGDQAWNTALTH